eukprot:1191720-Prorocentrum_minimum.AAC.1
MQEFIPLCRPRIPLYGRRIPLYRPLIPLYRPLIPLLCFIVHPSGGVRAEIGGGAQEAVGGGGAEGGAAGTRGTPSLQRTLPALVCEATRSREWPPSTFRCNPDGCACKHHQVEEALLDTDIYVVWKESVGEPNLRVIRRLDKVLTVNSTVSASSPTVGFPVSD